MRKFKVELEGLHQELSLSLKKQKETWELYLQDRQEFLLLQSYVASWEESRQHLSILRQECA